MPTYRPNAEFLRAAIESLMRQSYRHWTLHICDEPTEVDTQLILGKYLTDSRISYKKNYKQLGIGVNWNLCLESANGDYIQFLFQDDVWEHDYLQTGVSVLDSHSDISLVSLGHEYHFEGSTKFEDVYRELKNFTARHLYEGRREGMELLLWWMEHGLHPNIIGEPPFVMLRKATVEKVGDFREDMHQNLDSEYWIRMLRHGNWWYQPGNYGMFRVHAAAASAQNATMGRGIFDRLRMLQRVIPSMPKEHQTKAKTMMQRHIGEMVVKFVKRYGDKRIIFRRNQTVQSLILRNWWVIGRSILQYFLKTVPSR